MNASTKETGFCDGVQVPFCACGGTDCPCHPSNHKLGCTPCIAKNLREREIPTCFFAAAGGEKPTEGWHFEDFAALIQSLQEKDKAANRITLCKADDVSKYLPQIDDTGADPDFVRELLEDGEDIFAICLDDKTVGLSVISREEDSGFLYIYIFPAYRRQGYGHAAACLAEQQVLSPELRRMETTYSQNSAAAERFAEKCGFAEKYASARMKYHGEKYEIPPLPVRQYEDKDYPAAFKLSAEAFHKMRLETGRFPDSVPEAPSDACRERWRSTADERYVYVLDGEIVGYAHVEGNVLDSVSIKISRQGTGLGSGFVRFLVNLILEKNAGTPYLWCVVGNNKARRLYDSLGFEEVSREAFAVKKITNEE